MHLYHHYFKPVARFVLDLLLPGARVEPSGPSGLGYGGTAQRNSVPTGAALKPIPHLC